MHQYCKHTLDKEMANILFLIKLRILIFFSSLVVGEFPMHAGVATLDDYVITRQHSVANNELRINPNFRSNMKKKEIMQ